LLAAGIDAVGIDLSLPMLRRARQQLGAGAPLAQMDLHRLGLRRGFELALLPYSLITYVLDERGWEALAAELRAVLHPGGRVVLDAFVPQPGLVGQSWIGDYARRQPQGWLVRHKRIESLSGGLRRIQRRYRLRGAFGGRSLLTEELMRPYPEEELAALARYHLGEVERVRWDYSQAESATARFYTLTVVLRSG
jgi:SAM-dependent methyltransferase